MEVVIGLFLLCVATAVIVGGFKAYRLLMTHAEELSVPRPEPVAEDVEVSGEVGPDGLVYLFAHDFVRHKQAPPTVPARDRAYAPLTEDELDPEDWAQQILYASLCELAADSSVHFRVVDRSPTFMPPYPQKRWELQVIQRTPFPQSTVADALDVAFGLLIRRKEQRVAQGKEQPGEVWCALDEIIERALKAMRQEISFWERSGVYGDLRNYVASALVAQGYLMSPGKETWLDRTRSRRPIPNETAVAELRRDAEALQRRLRQFCLKHGSPHARGDLPPDATAPGLKGVDPSLAAREESFDEMPLDDVLRISIYETLVSLKALEPSRDGGM